MTPTLNKPGYPYKCVNEHANLTHIGIEYRPAYEQFYMLINIQVSLRFLFKATTLAECNETTAQLTHKGEA